MSGQSRLNRNACRMIALAAGAACCIASISSAQTNKTPAAPATTPAAQPAGLALPSADSTTVGRVTKPGTIRLMSRQMTIDFTETRLEDAVKFIAEYTGAELEPIWTEGSEEGLNKDFQITMKVKNVPALTVLEKILDKAKTDFSENTWQMTDLGSIEFGPKTALNKHKRLEIYDIHDLFFEIKTYDQVPQIDLQSLLQQSQGGGGGGGQSPFKDDQNDQQNRNNPEQARMRLQQKADDLIALITGLVEPDQWNDAGGEGGTIKHYQGTLIINAPDYMHRAINGYKWWPAGYTATKVEDRRYVSLSVGGENGTVDGIRNFPISGIVPGRGGSGGAGGGNNPPTPVEPGGKKAPANSKDPKGSKAKVKDTAKKSTSPATKPDSKPDASKAPADDKK